jgi:hypothetical protein
MSFGTPTIPEFRDTHNPACLVTSGFRGTHGALKFGTPTEFRDTHDPLISKARQIAAAPATDVRPDFGTPDFGTPTELRDGALLGHPQSPISKARQIAAAPATDIEAAAAVR